MGLEDVLRSRSTGEQEAALLITVLVNMMGGAVIVSEEDVEAASRLTLSVEATRAIPGTFLIKVE